VSFTINNLYEFLLPVLQQWFSSGKQCDHIVKTQKSSSIPLCPCFSTWLDVPVCYLHFIHCRNCQNRSSTGHLWQYEL